MQHSQPYTRAHILRQRVRACAEHLWGGVEKTDVFMDKAKVTTPPHHRLRYALGRTNPSDHYASSSYHVLPWFNCVVSQTSGTRFQMIIEI